MINIKIDPHGLNKDEPNDLVVRNEDQFIKSRLKIKDVLKKGEDLNVIVKNRKIERWYESLREYPDVKIEIISPSSVLSEILNLNAHLSLNLPLNDSEIQELELINKAETERPQTKLAIIKDIEIWVLSVCIDECWGKKGGTLSHLSEMVSFFLTEIEPQTHAALEELKGKQKEQWFNSSVGKAYRWLFRAPKDRSFIIYAWQILKNYDMKMKEKILEELTKHDQNVLKHIDRYLKQIPNCECSDNSEKKLEFNDLLEIRWKKILRTKLEYKKGEIKEKKDDVLKKRFQKLINEVITSMSGKMSGEVKAFLAFVNDNSFYFSKELFNLIAAKFALFPAQIKELNRLIPEEFPSEPKIEWDWNHISEWAKKEYFPYKKWLLRQKKQNRKIEEFAEIYSDWLYKKYPELKNELSALIYGTWYRIKKYIEQGCQILWIIIDNLCWFYLQDVIEAFKEQALYCSSEPILCLSMLPSETKISKTALVAGRLPNQIEDEKYQNYKLLFEDFCKKNNITTFKAISENEFRGSKLEEHQITCCIINKLDVSSHGGFFDFEDEIKDFLRRIANYVKDFLPSDLSLKKFYLIISTDHGSCIIPPNIKKLKPPKETRIEKKHKRFVYTELGLNLSENWYFLDKNKFDLKESIAIPKGYCFIGNRVPKGLVHGGMTPEETLVPYMEFCLKPLELKAIKCFHDSSPIPIGTRKHKVELSVQNLNDHDIFNVNLYIPTHSIEVNIEKIPSKDEVFQCIEIAISKEEFIDFKDNVVTLPGFYSYDCLGELKRGSLEVKIKIRKIIDISGTAEELFKF